jgi:hypothetical protein
MAILRDALPLKRPNRKAFRILLWLVASVILGVVFTVYYYVPADPRCKDILDHPDGGVTVPLPLNCTLSADAPNDQKKAQFENERRRRGLVFKAWVVCGPTSQVQSIEFAYTLDSFERGLAGLVFAHSTGARPNTVHFVHLIF